MANAKYEVVEKGAEFAVLRDGEEIATFEPGAGLTMKPRKKSLTNTAKAQIARYLGIDPKAVQWAEPEDPGKAPADPKSLKGEKEPDVKKLPLGDKSPVYIEWFRQNKSEEEFTEKYGHRKIKR